MKLQNFTGDQKFSASQDKVVKIGADAEKGGQGNDNDATFSSGDIDNIWDDDSLVDMPSKEDPKDTSDPEDSIDEVDVKGDEPNPKENASKAKSKEEKAKEKIIEAILADGSRLPVSSTSKFPVKVRGEESLVSVQDLINTYSGEKDFHNLYNHLNKERQTFENQRKAFQKSEEAWNSFSKSVADRIKSGNPDQIIDAWEDLIGKAGVDPGQFSHFVVKSLMPSIQKYSSMSQEEQRLYDRQVEIDARERAFQRSEKARQAKLAEEEREKFITSVTKEVEEKNQAYGFSMEDFDNGFKKLEDMQRKGHLQIKDIEPDHVYAFLMKENVEKRAQDLLSSEAPEFSKDKAKAQDFIRFVTKHVMTDFWSKDLQGAEYYEEMAKDYLSKFVAKEVSKKVAQTKPAPEVVKRRPGQKSQAPKSPLKTTREVSSEDLSFLKNGHVDW